MAEVFKRNQLYFISYAVFLLFGAILLLRYSSRELFFAINAWHAPFADYFFLYITHIGLGGVAAIFILLLALRRWRYAVTGLIAYALTAGITQFLKHFVFPHRFRPYKTFEGSDIRLIEGFEPYLYNSFPSGHTSTAFCLFTLLALYFPFRGSWLVYILLAFAVGYSRLYLSVHHFADVYTGSIIGVFCTLVVYMYLYRPHGPLKKYNNWLDRSLLKKRT